jgi:hypothetical protein
LQQHKAAEMVAAVDATAAAAVVVVVDIRSAVGAAPKAVADIKGEAAARAVAVIERVTHRSVTEAIRMAVALHRAADIPTAVSAAVAHAIVRAAIRILLGQQAVVETAKVKVPTVLLPVVEAHNAAAEPHPVEAADNQMSPRLPILVLPVAARPMVLYRAPVETDLATTPGQ